MRTGDSPDMSKQAAILRQVLAVSVLWLGSASALADDSLLLKPSASGDVPVSTSTLDADSGAALGPGTAPPPSALWTPTSFVKPLESSWYTRIDYFQWTERIEDMTLVKESGALYTLGYVRRNGVQRFRAELFGGNMHYDGYGQSYDQPLEDFNSTTRYLGARGDYEFVLAPPLLEGQFAFLVGLGNRFWIRDIRGGLSEEGHPVWGALEVWWTLYPYLGMECHRPLGPGLELYSEARIGATAITFEHAADMVEALWPRCGLTTEVELGLRGERFFLSATCEAMTWSHSSVVEDAFQPNSEFVTIGGKLGFRF